MAGLNNEILGELDHSQGLRVAQARTSFKAFQSK
jgi:hypothetical protein